MVNPLPRTRPPTTVDQPIDGPGVSHIDPSDPAAPMYRLLAVMRTPLALRDIMIKPVREGYIGDHPIDPSQLPPSAADLYPKVVVTDISVPSTAGSVRCQVYSPGAAVQGLPLMLYAHGGGFSVGRADDTAYITSRIAWENGMVVVSANYRQRVTQDHARRRMTSTPCSRIPADRKGRAYDRDV